MTLGFPGSLDTTAAASCGRRRISPILARDGIIGAQHPLVSSTGLRVLATGGNAVDAAVAAVLMSFVAESPLTGPGAGGFMVVHTGGASHVLDFFVAIPGRGLAALHPQGAADVREDVVAGGGVAHGPLRRARSLRQRAWKVSPCGAGKSRFFVQLPASGSAAKRPLERPRSARPPIAARVARR